MLLTQHATFFSMLIPSILLPLNLLGLTTTAAAQSSNASDLAWVPFDRTQFNDSIALDPVGDVQLFWKTGDEYSTYGIASRSTGYLALGFSETGAMTGADMALGYSDQNGSFVFENRHALGFITPQVSPDQKDNMRLKEGHQANGVTSFVFEKKNKAQCLQTQVDVATDAWQWFIYAFSDRNTFAQHSPGKMGKQYVKLGAGKTISLNEIRTIPDAKNFTIVQPEVTIPTEETTYCHSLHKMPAGNKNFLLGELPNQSSKLLHHLVVYACYGLPEEYKAMIGQPANCDYQNFSNPCNGFVTEWAPGMTGRTFESGYGKPFGSDSYEYVMFETHYNNPQGLVGEKDNASYTFLYDDKPVDTEVGTLTLGDLQVEGWFLEPGKELVAHSTVCTPECTDNWPADGITAVSVFHHMHFRGRNARVQVIRDGKEITPLSSLRSFEYGYQFSKNLNEVKLLPGDKLITTCEYDTMNDTQPVPGGLSSRDEMCFAWVDYYPANAILACTQIDMGSYPANPINGSAGLCMNASAASPDVYPSTFLTSSFQNLTASGNNCPVDNTTSSTGQPNQAAVLSTCPETDICFALNVPEQSASSGSGDIYFQLSAPSTYSWVALAQGTMMSNANMFLMYASADGKNVTLSPRSASEHVMPTYNNASDISLLEGSGISNGKMTANVRCSNCNSWGTSTMSLQDGSSNWVYAHSQGAPINSDDTNAVISKHDGQGGFQWDLSRATGGSDANPFIGAAAKTTSSSSNGGSNSWRKLSTQTQNRFVQAHGALASIVFVAILPIGAILIRFTNFRGLVWVHGGFQVFGYAIFVAAAGLGIFIANGAAYLHEPHAIIGMILLAVLFFMPLMGTLHHKGYKKVQKRTIWSYGHIFTGRVGIILGMINGGLGLQLADARRSSKIVYGIFAGLMGVIYIGAFVFGEAKRANRPPQSSAVSSSAHTEPKQIKRDDSGSGSEVSR